MGSLISNVGCRASTESVRRSPVHLGPFTVPAWPGEAHAQTSMPVSVVLSTANRLPSATSGTRFSLYRSGIGFARLGDRHEGQPATRRAGWAVGLRAEAQPASRSTRRDLSIEGYVTGQMMLSPVGLTERTAARGRRGYRRSPCAASVALLPERTRNGHRTPHLSANMAVLLNVVQAVYPAYASVYRRLPFGKRKELGQCRWLSS